MNMRDWTLLFSAVWVALFPTLGCTAPRQSSNETGNSHPTLQTIVIVQVIDAKIADDDPAPVEPVKTIADPFEPMNRLFFQFNDRLYFWFVKPIASTYAKLINEPARVGVRNFFTNLATPIRLGNCLLQFKFRGAGVETFRFAVNSTIGMLGFIDIAKKEFDLDVQEEDLGQTLGFYGIGPVFYINWPVLGPSSLRDTAGFVGDLYLDPWVRIVESAAGWAIAHGYGRLNRASLTIGDYESLKRASLDPYVAMRDAYYQFRESKVKE